MSTFGGFIKKLINFTLPGIWYNNISALFGKDNMYKNLFDTASAGDTMESLYNKYTEAGPTGRDVWELQQNERLAKEQRDWEERMSNTSIQRGVADARAAGVNPALMFGGMQGASTPSGSTASVATGNSANLSDLLALLALPAQIKNIEANTKKTNFEVDNELPARVAQLQESVVETKSRVRNFSLEGDEKEIILRYLDRQQNFYTESLGLGNEKISQEINESVARVNNLQNKDKEILQNIAESQQRVKNLLAEESLTREQIKEVVESINEIKARTEYLKSQTKLTDKDIEWYTANHIITPAVNLAGDIIGAGSKIFGKTASKIVKAGSR